MNEQLRKAIEHASIPPYNDPHESWCDTENSISKRCNCMASSYLDVLEDAKESQAKLLRVIELLVEQRKANLNSQLLASQAGYSYTIDGLIDYLDAELIAALEGK